MEDGNQMNNILYEDNHIIVVEKKVNVPVQEDESKDKDLLDKFRNRIIQELIDNQIPDGKILTQYINEEIFRFSNKNSSFSR